MIIKKNNEFLLIVKIYLLAISLFFMFRLLLFFTEIDRINFDNVSLLTVIRAFIMGIRFDIVISGYILFLPTLIILTLRLLKKDYLIIRKILFYFTFTLFSIAFAIAAADIPYFNQFYSRFSIEAFEWMDNPDFVFSMIFHEPKYFLAFIPFLISIFIFFIILKKIFYAKTEKPKYNFVVELIVSLLFLSIMFLGIRGRVQKKSPIRIGTAYFCNNSLLNQLGLNPVFTLMTSYLDSQNKNNQKIHLIDDDIAIKNVQKYLKIKNQIYNSPIARNITYDTSVNRKPNVVIIIMESMSAAKMTRYGNKDNLTPFLDSLSYQSYYFNNIYTAGEHTFNGIFSTLFSFPAIFRQHTMKQIHKFDGISYVLSKYGYSTTYFTTHDGQFDNVAGFLKANDFQNIISQSNYPSSEIKTTLGVPDDYMFRFSIPIINKLASSDKPFLVAFMTASDHGPYYVPDYFHPRNKKIKKQTVEYADWSLKKFISLSSKQKWFDNTIFVFVADHGAPISAPYDISLDYHHSPLIFYAPKLLDKPKEFDFIGGQIDIFPTIMGLLKLSYINNTLGIDLLNEKRPYIFINADDKIGVLDTTYLLILNSKLKTKMYNYSDNSLINCYNKHKDKAKRMEIYAKSNLQVYQYMLLNNKTTIHALKIDSINK